MSKYLELILSDFILMSSVIVCWNKLLDKKINFKDPKIYITIVGLMIASFLNYFIVEKFIRVVVITIILMFFIKFLYNENLQKTILVPIFHQIIILLSEFLTVLILMILCNSEQLIETLVGIIVVNILVAIISILIVNLKITRKLLNNLLKITDKIKMNQLIIFCLISILFVNLFVMSAYYKIEFKYWITINMLLIAILCITIIYSLKTQNNYNKVSDKYNIAIRSLNDYESMMSKYRIANHENKNLLLTVRAMILNKEKDIPKFIDTIVEEKFEDDEKLLFKMGVIPSGGLRATIYSEIMKIKDNNINYSLEIDSKLRSVDLIELDTNTIIDICKIIGVFIDNAIDEVKSLRKKNIDISLYLEDNNLVIKVSNNYKGKIEIDKIANEGYTTKGKNHGYGLSLVKSIVDNNNLFKNETSISKDIFSQILIIKYKKAHR